MNLSRLLLAGVLVTLPCACKKDDGSGTSSGDRPGARTKTSLRQEDGGGVDGKAGNRHSMPVESRESAELIDAAEAAYMARQNLTSQLSTNAMEESLAKVLDDENELSKVQEKIDEASKRSAEVERNYLKAMNALRSRQKKDPEESLSGYLAFAKQRDLLVTRQKEISEAGVSGTAEEAMKLREELKEEGAKLRELRAAWKGEEKAPELPTEPSEPSE